MWVTAGPTLEAIERGVRWGDRVKLDQIVGVVSPQPTPSQLKMNNINPADSVWVKYHPDVYFMRAPDPIYIAWAPKLARVFTIPTDM